MTDLLQVVEFGNQMGGPLGQRAAPRNTGAVMNHPCIPVNVNELPDWWWDGLCAETDPEAFYPEKGGTTEPAKRICARCPVTAQCLTYALDHNERYGIWGGMSERERRRLRTLPEAG